MTEQDFLACTDPTRMSAHLSGSMSHRKCWLFIVECVRRWWHAPNSWLRPYSPEELRKQQQELVAFELRADAGPWAPCPVHRSHLFRDLKEAAIAEQDFELAASLREAEGGQEPENIFSLAQFIARRTETSTWLSPAADVASLLRDLVGNPFRPSTLDPAWVQLTGGTVRNIAQRVYEERAYPSLPILADALEDAGRVDADLLTHLRGPGPHCRGCWALDRVLRKD